MYLKCYIEFDFIYLYTRWEDDLKRISLHQKVSELKNWIDLNK